MDQVPSRRSPHNELAQCRAATCKFGAEMTDHRLQPKKDEKRPIGRPPLEMPEQIPDTPENIAQAVLNTKPKKRDEWRFTKSHQETAQAD